MRRRRPAPTISKAEFRLWLPEITGPLRDVLMLVSGSNADGRPGVDDPVW